MFTDTQVPPPILFNPLKHHLGFIRKYINDNTKVEKQPDNSSIEKDLRHLGNSLMDIYCGPLTQSTVIEEIMIFLKANNLIGKDTFYKWIGKYPKDFKTIKLSDDSEWILKHFNNELRYVHPFPARSSLHSIRVKANTIKSAILFLIFKDKDFITENDLNGARAVCGLSPVRDVFEAEAITELIEIIRA